MPLFLNSSVAIVFLAVLLFSPSWAADPDEINKIIAEAGDPPAQCVT
jgi:hypothetical protein